MQQVLCKFCLAIVFASLLVAPCCAQDLEIGDQNGAITMDGEQVVDMMSTGDMEGAKNNLEALLIAGEKTEAEDVFFLTFGDQEMTDALVKVLILVYQDDAFDVSPLSSIYGDIYDFNRTALDYVLSEVIMELSKLPTPSKGFANAIVYAYTSRAAILYSSAHLKEPIEESLEIAIDVVGYDAVCPIVSTAVVEADNMAGLLKMQLKKVPLLVQCVE